MDSARQIVIEFTPGERRQLIAATGLSGLGLLTLLVLTLLFTIPNSTNSDSATLNILSFGLLSLSCIVLFIASVRSLQKTQRMGWYKGRIVVTPEFISWENPGSTFRSARWADLKYVVPSKRLLYFNDGTSIPLSLGPGKIGGISDKQLNSILALIDPQSLFVQAYSDYAIPRQEKAFARAVAVCTGIVILCYVVYMRNHLDVASQTMRMAGLIALFWGGSLMASIPRFRRLLGVRQKYHPPRAERSSFRTF